MQVFKGKIIVADELNTVASYLVEKEGRVAYIGDELPMAFADLDVIDLGPGALLPAFVDTYNHFSAYSIDRATLDISSAESNTEALDMIRQYASTVKEQFVVVYGATAHSVLEGKLITKDQLDAVCHDKPVIVFKYDGHSCVINSVFVNMIRDKAKNLRGYHESTGEMNQEAFAVVNEIWARSLSTRKVIDAMVHTADHIAERGIGMIHSASGMGFVRDMNMDMERSVANGFDNGMQMRVAFQTNDVSRAMKKDARRVVHGALDGTFGSADAALSYPYENTDDKGILYFTDDELIDFCKKANRAQMQIAIHAVGDAAFNQAAKAIAAALEDYPRYDHRHMIIHACMPDKEAIDICSKYHIFLSVQPTFIKWRMESKEYLNSILGTERVKTLNPIGTYLARGIKVCISSDAPSTEPNPMEWIHNLCNPYIPSQAIDVYDAIRLCTYNGCLSSFDERDRGTLEIGKIADMVVLDQDPYTIPKDKLNTINVKSLYLNGKQYHHSKSTPMATMLRGMFPQ